MAAYEVMHNNMTHNAHSEKKKKKRMHFNFSKQARWNEFLFQE